MTVSLRDRLKGLIARQGPLPVSRFMTLCLHDPMDGYYATRPALGAEGDFLTAPLISQIFGECLGSWVAAAWIELGRPAPFRLIELGPGLGVMMTDVLRAARAAPGFLDAMDLWLVEASAPLRRRQAVALEGLAQPRWAETLGAVAGRGPVLLLANEFLDCLPIDQIIRTPTGWRERLVVLDAAGELAFGQGGEVAAPETAGRPTVGSVVERSDALRDFGREAGGLIAREGGVALFIDYGRDSAGTGDTLQALRRHVKESPLARPGEADLTAHADFPAFLAAARGAGARTTPIITQGEFLTAIGAPLRGAVLSRSRPDKAEVIARQLERLIAPAQMGQLFKVAALLGPGATAPGFEDL